MFLAVVQVCCCCPRPNTRKVGRRGVFAYDDNVSVTGAGAAPLPKFRCVEFLTVADTFSIRRVAIDKHFFVFRKNQSAIITTTNQDIVQVGELTYKICLAFLEVVADGATLCICGRAVTTAVHTGVVRRKKQYCRAVPTRVFFGVVAHVVVFVARRRM